MATKTMKTLSKIWEKFWYPENYIGDRTIDEVYQNPADKKLINETVEQLKRKYIPQGIEITLSCGTKLTISI